MQAMKEYLRFETVVFEPSGKFGTLRRLLLNKLVFEGGDLSYNRRRMIGNEPGDGWVAFDMVVESKPKTLCENPAAEQLPFRVVDLDPSDRGSQDNDVVFAGNVLYIRFEDRRGAAVFVRDPKKGNNYVQSLPAVILSGLHDCQLKHWLAQFANQLVADRVVHLRSEMYPAVNKKKKQKRQRLSPQERAKERAERYWQ